MLLLALGGCVARGDITKPIPSTFFAAAQPARRLVIMLPGRGDDLDALKQHRMAQVIQQHWPDADVVLTGLTMPWYRQGLASKRLHDDVIAPAIAKGHRDVWVLGISLGGMGALLYDHEYPGEIAGMLLLSPYLGDDAIRDEVVAAGGLARWNAGPPQVLGPDTFQHELWRSLQHRLRTDPASVWIAYGDAEPFRDAIELATPLLPNGHALALPGQHDWSLWSAAVPEILDRAAGASIDPYVMSDEDLFRQSGQTWHFNAYTHWEDLRLLDNGVYIEKHGCDICIGSETYDRGTWLRSGERVTLTFPSAARPVAELQFRTIAGCRVLVPQHAMNDPDYLAAYDAYVRDDAPCPQLHERSQQ